MTLTEVMLAAGLVAVLYTIMAYITVQVSQASRRGAEAALRKIELLKTTEQLRWQLRGLYVPPEYSVKDEAPSASPGASPAPSQAATPDAGPARASRPGFVPGKLVLFGERTQSDQSDVLIFLTNEPAGGVRGVAEVGYKIIEVDGQRVLHYRQFNYRDADGLHLPTDQVEAPWKPLNKQITHFWVEYSADGGNWQREWENEEPPRRVRLNVATRGGENLVFYSSPGVSSERW